MSITELLNQYGSKYVSSLLMTWELTAISFAAAFVLGVLLTVIRVCPIKPLRMLGDFYVQLFRNIPGVALLLLIVYGLYYLDIVVSYFMGVLLTTSLIPAAFCSEYLMSGMNMIHVGQIEAARALGMSFFQIISKIVIPQALRSTVLPLTNLLVSTMLTTALASQLPRPQELTGLVKSINTNAVGGITAFFISAMLYCLTAVVIGQLGNMLDRKVRIAR